MKYLIKGQRNWGTEAESFYKPTGYCLLCRKTKKVWEAELHDRWRRLYGRNGYLYSPDEMPFTHLGLVHNIYRISYYGKYWMRGKSRVVR